MLLHRCLLASLTKYTNKNGTKSHNTRFLVSLSVSMAESQQQTEQPTHTKPLSAQRRDAEFVRALQALPIEERNKANIKSYLEDKRKKVEAKKDVYCAGCWLSKRECMCNDIKPVPSFHRYIVYIHHKEWFRGTNTGILMKLGNPITEFITSGVEEDEARLAEILKAEPNNTIVMFPSADSVVFTDFLARGTASDDVEDLQKKISTLGLDPGHSLSQPSAQKQKRMNVIVLEGTWNQARTLLKQLPTWVPRIKLEELPDSKSISHMRKQTMEGRVTTAEAIAYFFKELGESEEAQEALWYNLKLRISRMDAQTNREGPVKGAATKKKTPKAEQSSHDSSL
eukprot:TRINITY_DN8201_c0_g1_i1.p1 TRINITY_DN8201_c0_g1~~TRINITY_DN8201_c0_g1_i1.p1  ORF type:complete len:340 (+),score=54.23 TRINITY_DN8201_c0_g1_i1:50-1069(+)